LSANAVIYVGVIAAAGAVLIALLIMTIVFGVRARKLANKNSNSVPLQPTHAAQPPQATTQPATTAGTQPVKPVTTAGAQPAAAKQASDDTDDGESTEYTDDGDEDGTEEGDDDGKDDGTDEGDDDGTDEGDDDGSDEGDDEEGSTEDASSDGK
jgi:hypothetical protein